MPLSPRSVGFKYSARVETLTASDVLEIVCPHCSKGYLVAPYQLRLKFMPSLGLDEVALRFRCKSCGYKANRKCTARWSVYTAKPLVYDVG